MSVHAVPKALYFASNYLIYVLHNYKAQFLVERKSVPVDRIGMVYAVVGMNFVGSIVWSRLADRLQLHRAISVVAPWLYAVSAAFYLVPGVPKAWQSVYVTAVMGVSNFFSSAIFPLLDAMVFALLRRDAQASFDGDRALFGRQRLFGTLAIPMATTTAYLLITFTDNNNYTALFVNMFVAACLYSAIVYFGVPPDLQVGAKEKQQDDGLDEQGPAKGTPPSFWQIIRFTSPALPVLLLFVLSSGYLRALMNIYQNYMVDGLLESHRRGPLILSMVRTVSEAVCFFLSKTVIDGVGVWGALIISQLAGIARVLGYGLMPRRTQSVLMVAAPLELLKGINTGLVVSAATRLGNQMAPPNAHGTVHGLLAGTYTGLAMAIGGCLSSAMMQWCVVPEHLVSGGDAKDAIYFKLQYMFLWSAAGSAVVLGVFCGCFRMFTNIQ